ncbi:hypothetical protein Poly21_43510 [Allorhodopirellula heiligendammensis]|uniref:Uncharacterized protein n=1 Tax=Allorhodopirellula heiligendammensis TaxID=2714739 RepID=A0A5C6BFM7_9BACT|nr:hypothetical protein Poly21_43510 [Allorhodopirellula heiligendammensis]
MNWPVPAFRRFCHWVTRLVGWHHGVVELGYGSAQALNGSLAGV